MGRFNLVLGLSGGGVYSASATTYQLRLDLFCPELDHPI